MPMRRLKKRMCGSVASPTPTMPISLDSISRMPMSRAEHARERRGRHPAGGAAADDHDVAIAQIGLAVTRPQAQPRG